MYSSNVYFDAVKYKTLHYALLLYGVEPYCIPLYSYTLNHVHHNRDIDNRVLPDLMFCRSLMNAASQIVAKFASTSQGNTYKGNGPSAVLLLERDVETISSRKRVLGMDSRAKRTLVQASKQGRFMYHHANPQVCTSTNR